MPQVAPQGSSAGFIEQRRADALLSASAHIRGLAAGLPDEDKVSRAFVRKADEWELAAQIEWPPLLVE